MANQYLNWLDQIESAQDNGARIKDFFQPYPHRHPTSPHSAPPVHTEGMR